MTSLDDRKKAALDGIEERLSTLEGIMANKAAVDPSGIGERFTRWKEGTTTFLAKYVSPQEAKKFSRPRAVEMYPDYGGGLAPPWWLGDAAEARTFLSGLARDIDERPGEIVVTPPPAEQHPPAVGPVAVGGLQDPDPRKVFVVHGRNEEARRALFSFLRAIKLDPLEWSEAVALTKAGAPYVGQILDKAFSQVRAVVVLLTGDDYAGLQPPFVGASDGPDEIGPTPQARPNVLFEAGMAFGRHPDRTILVELGKLRPFSDVGGRHVIRLDNSSKRRKALAERLHTCGCKVDLGGDDWLHEGDFESVLPDAAPLREFAPPIRPERRPLEGFEELTFEPAPEGERRFVWRYPPGWDVPEAPPERPISTEEEFWLSVAIWSVPDLMPVSYEPSRASATEHRIVYETDRERTSRRRVLKESNRQVVGIAARRQGESEPDKCIRDRQYISGGGRFCRVCGRTVEELRQTNEADLREYREKREATAR